jgi:arginyl-tRNA synthetase
LQKFIKNFIENKLDKQIVLEKPKDISLGHFSTPIAFSLAKKLRKNPIQIANDLSLIFKDDTIFESVQSIKGFINFKLSEQFLSTKIDEALSLKDDFAKQSSKKQKILLEYVSANPTGPLHIGHARGAILGDTLMRIGRHLGYKMTSEYYVNDAGSQMDLLGLSVYLAGQEHILKKNVKYPEQYYRGYYLFYIANLCAKKFGKDIFKEKSKQKKLSLFAKDEILKLIQKDISDLGITFDNYISEKSLYSSWNKTKSILEDNGSIYQKDGKDWIKSTQLGDNVDRVVVRNNGIPTYLAGDIIYHKNKYDRNFDKYINIWGADHHGYITRVKAGIKFLGNDPEKLEIILSQMVSLLKGGKPYKVSKRKGNVILMSDITQQIGSDALRFIFLTKKSDTHLEFDIDTLKNQDSTNPIFYINYAHARINQLFKKAGKSFKDVKDTTILNINQDTKNLVYEALLLPSILEEAFNKRDIQKVTDYLHSLSASVHSFYSEYKIIGTDNENEYLKALSMTSLSIKTALKLLGITAKEVM